MRNISFVVKNLKNKLFYEEFIYFPMKSLKFLRISLQQGGLTLIITYYEGLYNGLKFTKAYLYIRT